MIKGITENYVDRPVCELQMVKVARKHSLIVGSWIQVDPNGKEAVFNENLAFSAVASSKAKNRRPSRESRQCIDALC